MKKLNISQMKTLIEQSERLSAKGDSPEWRTFCQKIQQINVRVDMPLGELMNEHISGALLVWQLKGLIQLGEIKDYHSFNAQGLEGCFSVEVDLAQALIAAMNTPLDRINIFIPNEDWKRIL